MSTPLRKLIIFLVIIVVVSSSSSSVSNAFGLTPKVHVQVTNDLGAGLDLTLHCKSGDDDLCQHLVPFGESYVFHFRASMMGRTLFFCSMAWKEELHWFDVYKQYRDDDKCGEHCLWFIRPTGPCLMINQTTTNLCYQWPS
ncbi:hypothetical protein Dsin_027346 [Dipteronia sinensis]|uniref:S-protein homolog n=1 Tax=Dipteronia sinensis TaxID=43782 RepID=A0AAD9ZNJ5_9ROSI|nr:hypothetical protein Dsin_027346 [Dipteronia sinensis]